MKVATLCRLIRENDPRLTITSMEDYNAQNIERVLRALHQSRSNNVRIQMLVLRHCQLSVSSLMTILKHLCRRQEDNTVSRSPLNVLKICLHEVGYNIPVDDLAVAVLYGMATDDPPGLGDVQMLDLCMDNITECSLGALQLVLEKTTAGLRHLELAQGNWVNDAVMANICESVCANPSTELLILNLAGNLIGNMGAKHLARVLQTSTTHLTILQLASNNIGDKGARALAMALANHNQTLVDLDLEQNQIGDKGVMALARAVTVNSNLKALSVKRNHRVTGAGEQVLLEAVARMQGLRKLSFGPIQWTANLARLATSMEQNTQLKFINYVFREETFQNREEDLKPFPWHLRPARSDLRYYRTSVRAEYPDIVVPDLKIEMLAKYIPSITFWCEMNRKPLRSLSFQPHDSVPLGLWPLVIPKAKEPEQLFCVLRQRPDLVSGVTDEGTNDDLSDRMGDMGI